MRDEWRPTRRLVKNADGTTFGAYAFIHPCWICGDPQAAFGFDVNLLKYQPGKWACAKHRADVERLRFERIGDEEWRVTEPTTSGRNTPSPMLPEDMELL